MLLKPLLTAGVFWYIVHGPNGHSDHPSSLCHQSGLSEAQFQVLLVAADLAYIEGDVKIRNPRAWKDFFSQVGVSADAFENDAKNAI